MERTEPHICYSDGGLNTLICQEDLNDEEPKTYHQSNQSKLKVFLLSVIPGRGNRLAAGILVLLAAVLLLVDISLGVHYNKLKDTHLTLEDTELISIELAELQQILKIAVSNMTGSHKQLDSEMKHQQETNWELEHQKKRGEAYKTQIEQLKADNENMKSHLPMIADGCKRCPSGWILMNSVCFYFSFSDTDGLKSWRKAREFCQIYGGDLVVIDSKDKEKLIVNHLLKNQHPSKVDTGYWFGLKDSQVEGTWKWLDGTELMEAYWDDGEPNDHGNEDCAAVYAKINFFKAWNDARCEYGQKWICEKVPTSDV